MYKVEEGKIQLENGSISEGLIAIASGKGGVGKSTVTVNLAISLAKAGKKVGILDADIYGFSIPRIIGLKDEAKTKDNKTIIPPKSFNIKVISMGSFVDEKNPVVWRAPLLSGALQQFMQDVEWGELDYLLLDLPPGTGDMALDIMQNLPHAEVLVVTTPQPTAVHVAGRIGKVAEKLDVDVLGVIENMSYFRCDDCGHKEYIFGQGGGKDLAKELNTDLLGQLPLDPIARQASDDGLPIVEAKKELEITKVYKKISETITAKNSEFDPNKKPISLQNGPTCH